MNNENTQTRAQRHTNTNNPTTPSPNLYDQLNRDMNPFYRFFCWCAGAQIDVLKHFPTEWNKFFGTGTAVFMTGLFALLSSSYALIEVFKDQITGDFNFLYILPVSISWAGFIFFLDRFLVSSINMKDGSWWQWVLVLIRLLLAALIGIVISRPLEFRICQKEIIEWLGDEKTEKLITTNATFDSLRATEERLGEARIKDADPEIVSLRAQIRELENQNIDDEKRIKEAVDEAAKEAYGTGGSGRPGTGKVYAQRIKELNDLKAKLEVDRQRRLNEINGKQQRIRDLQQRSDQFTLTATEENKRKIEEIETTRTAKIKNIQETFATSLLAQNRALEGLIQNGQQHWMIFLITLLFVMLEISPIVVKLFTRVGPYEEAIADLEFQARSESRQRKHLTRQELNLNKRLLVQMALAEKDLLSKQIIDDTEIRREEMRLENEQKREEMRRRNEGGDYSQQR